MTKQRRSFTDACKREAVTLLASSGRAKANGIVPSMRRKGTCRDNAPMEGGFHTLKAEPVHHTRYTSRDEARRDLFAHIETYVNRQQRHFALARRLPSKWRLRRH